MPLKEWTKSDFLGIMKMALRYCIKDIHFTDPDQEIRVFGDLMNEITVKLNILATNMWYK